MSFETYLDKKRSADARRRDRDFEEAGTLYTSAAYAGFGATHLSGFGQLSSGLVCLLSACLCYRLAGNSARTRNRARQGILIVEDIRDHIVETDLERALTAEYVGDFRVMAGIDDYASSYSRARDTYTSFEDSTTIEERIGHLSEECFSNNTVFLRRIRDATSVELDEELRKDIENRSPVARIDFKTERLPELVDMILSQSTWNFEENRS